MSAAVGTQFLLSEGWRVILLDYPLLLFVVAFAALWLAAWLSALWGRRRRGPFVEDMRTDFNIVETAALGLLGLVIGFTFSMAMSRYDQRKNYEEEEANAIGTEYLRADLLPAADGARVRELLRRYLDLRIQNYGARNDDSLRRIEAETARVQSELWAAVSGSVKAQEPMTVVTLTVGGMNDVLNSQGYTQAAWLNRIPKEAWLLLFAIAICCNVLLGYGARRLEPRLFMVLPLVAAIAFFLIAEIDSPRSGLIRVHPQNLQSLRDGLR
jgi:hypothetical protein